MSYWQNRKYAPSKVKRDRKDRGLHLLGTLTNCEPGFLCWRFGLFKLLQRMPSKLGMRIIPVIENPLVIRANHPNYPKESGYTGFVLLWESHVSIHTWDTYRELDFDVFSCKPFDHLKVMKILKAFFKGDVASAALVDRNSCEIIWRHNGNL